VTSYIAERSDRFRTRACRLTQRRWMIRQDRSSGGRCNWHRSSRDRRRSCGSHAFRVVLQMLHDGKKEGRLIKKRRAHVKQCGINSRLPCESDEQKRRRGQDQLPTVSNAAGCRKDRWKPLSIIRWDARALSPISTDMERKETCNRYDETHQTVVSFTFRPVARAALCSHAHFT
jgi:hypothetical protein